MTGHVTTPPKTLRCKSEGKKVTIYFDQQIAEVEVEKTYNRQTWQRATEPTLQSLLRELFTLKHVRAVKVRSRRITILRDGATLDRVKGLVLRAGRELGWDLEFAE